MLSKEFIDQAKKKLEAEKSRLEKELDELSKTDFGHDRVANEDEQLTEAEQNEDNQAIADDYSERLADIDEALEKIREGTYGKCENCGKDIEEKILTIDPESSLCEKCKALAK